MKRGLSILVLCVFLAHFAGFYIYFFVHLTQVRKEMKAHLQKLPTEKLELIKLTSRNFEKARVEDHEIKIDGKMYDISRIEKKGDMIWVYCLHDEAEDSLLSFLDTVLSAPLKDKNVPSQLIKFTTLTFLLPATPSLQQYVSIRLLPAPHYKSGTSLFIPASDFPPPKA